MNSSRQRSEQANGGRNAPEALRVWAKALGCRPDQVVHVIRRAGLPEEKLWRSLART